jgi:hypothetical protein
MVYTHTSATHSVNKPSMASNQSSLIQAILSNFYGMRLELRKRVHICYPTHPACSELDGLYIRATDLLYILREAVLGTLSRQKKKRVDGLF